MQTHLDSFERLTTPKPWTDEEIALLFKLRRQEGRDWSVIALQLDRTESGVKSKFKYAVYHREIKVPSIPFVREPIPDLVLVEREKRLAANARDIAGAVFGDPPRGFSALDGAR